MEYAFRQQAVLASALCFQRDIDSFFSPVNLQHTGYAADGFYYADGVKNLSLVASWFSEAQSTTRGPLATFPAQALILVDRASVTILDATSEELNLWMLFYLANGGAVSNNTQGGPDSYSAASVSWDNGLLSITFQPDPGSTTQGPVVITIDFTADQAFADTRA